MAVLLVPNSNNSANIANTDPEWFFREEFANGKEYYAIMHGAPGPCLTPFP
jgi:hypothetical protein